jgi:hypothetical protein
MTSEKDGDPIKREGLKKRLASDISKLRTRGLGKPKAGDRSDLLKVAVLFAPTMPTDTERIDALVKIAIAQKWGSSLLARVSCLAFGADPSTQGETPEVRYRAAYKEYGSGKYTSFTTRTLPEISNDLAAQITEIYEDGEKNGWPAAGSPDPELETVRKEDTDKIAFPVPQADAIGTDSLLVHIRHQHPNFWGIVFVTTVGIVSAALVFYTYGVRLGEHNATTATPGRGTVIDARTGKAVEHPKVEPPDAGNEPHVGLLRYCDLTSGESCQLPIDATYYTEAKPFVAKSGDIIKASFTLYDDGNKPLPYFRLEVRAGRIQGQTQTEMENWIIWPTASGANTSYSPKQLALPEHGKNFQMIEATGAPLTGVAYISESTELLNSRGEQMAQLPDGIMGRRGVYLTDLGAPANCLCEGSQYVREVTFRFKVLDERS